MRPAFLHGRMQRLAARLTGAGNAAQVSASAAGETSGRSGAAGGAKWFPLPGNDRIEYAASGYVIMLRTDPKLTPYALFDPDRRLIAHGYVLKVLKEYGEQLASERAEFAQ